MKPKRALSSYILLLGVSSLLLVGTWITYQVWSALTKSQITETQVESILPLEGSVQQTAMDNLRRRRRFTPADFSAIVFNTGSPSATIAQ